LHNTKYSDLQADFLKIPALINMRKFPREYFSFSQSEIRILLILTTLIFISLAIRIFFPVPAFQTFELRPEDNLAIDSFVNSLEKISYPSRPQYEDKEDVSEPEPKPIYQNFDPNTVTPEELERMNFPSKIAKNLIRYREAGGKYFKKSDVKKLYGVSDSIFSLWESYILIPEQIGKDWDSAKHYKYVKSLFEINSVDSTELLELTGIGPFFAGKIVRYRIKLGGYSGTGQILEIKGMDSLRFQTICERLRVDTSLIVRVSLNETSVNALKLHPYISARMAESIMKYIQFNGGINNINELIENNIIIEEELTRLRPYLSVERK